MYQGILGLLFAIKIYDENYKNHVNAVAEPLPSCVTPERETAKYAAEE